MATTCLLDSSVIIDAINDRNGRSELLEDLIGQGTLLACRPINITEVYMGMRPHEAEKTAEFLASLEFSGNLGDCQKDAQTIALRRCEGHAPALVAYPRLVDEPEGWANPSQTTIQSTSGRSFSSGWRCRIGND